MIFRSPTPTVSLQEVSSGDEPLKVYLYDVAEESLDDSLDGAIIVRDDGNSSATRPFRFSTVASHVGGGLSLAQLTCQ